MINENKFNKICKYKTRLEKAYKNDNQDDCVKYFNHLKYHVGGLLQTQLHPRYINEIFDYILEIIEKSKSNLLDKIKKKEQENDELTNKLDELFKNIEKYLINYLKLQSVKVVDDKLIEDCIGVSKLLIKTLKHNNKEKYENVINELDILIQKNMANQSLYNILFPGLLKKILCYYDNITSNIPLDTCEEIKLVK